jgi:hypothetical protein
VRIITCLVVSRRSRRSLNVFPRSCRSRNDCNRRTTLGSACYEMAGGKGELGLSCSHPFIHYY